MINHQCYVVLSLETHLFFARMMKEQAYFLETDLLDSVWHLKEEANAYRKRFEALLGWAVARSNGMVSQFVLESREIVTENTLVCEQRSQALLGSAINQIVTHQAMNLVAGINPRISSILVSELSQINIEVVVLLHEFEAFQAAAYRQCQSHSNIHCDWNDKMAQIDDQAQCYRHALIDLEHGIQYRMRNPREILMSWSTIVLDHMLWIRSALGYFEKEKLDMVDDIIKQYRIYLGVVWTDLENLSLQWTNGVRLLMMEWKQWLEEECKKMMMYPSNSMLVPLHFDHVIRAMNYFQRLLVELA